MSNFKITEFVLLALAILGFIFCLIFAGRQVNPFHPPTTHRERLRRAVAVGLLTGGGFLFLFLIIDLVANSGFQWTIESLATVWLCLVLPFQILATIGTYIEFAWQEKIRRYLARLSERSREQQGKKR